MHGAGARQRGAGHGRFRITVTYRYQGCVHSAAEYIDRDGIVKGLFFALTALYGSDPLCESSVL